MLPVCEMVRLWQTQGEAFSTIHITPEEACCYASVELTGCPDVEPAAFVTKVCPPCSKCVMLTSARHLTHWRC